MYVAALFSKRARLWVAGRRNIFSRLRDATEGHGDIVWIHAASLGEFEQGRPIIEQIQRDYPEKKILITFYSPSGYEIRKSYHGADWVFYLPLDTPRSARRFVETVKPGVAIFIKYEFWYNFLNRLCRSGCKTYLISAIFRPDSIFFRPHGGLFRRMLRFFDHIFVQDSDSLELLKGIGVNNVTVAGDTRFDRVAAIVSSIKPLDAIERFKGDSEIFIAGSTWPADEDIMLQAIAANREMKFIIAPHEIDSERIENFIECCPRPAVCYSDFRTDPDIADAEVLIIDTIGILSSVYQYAGISYIGGGFGAGIHNTLEAATFGIPIAFGPNYRKFREACEMIELGCARPIANYGELQKWMDEVHSDGIHYEKLCRIAREYVVSHGGATSIILSRIDFQ